MKQWLKRMLFPEICFYTPKFSQNNDSDFPSMRWYWVFLFLSVTMWWPIYLLEEYRLHLGCFYCTLAVYYAGYLYSYNQKRMEYLMTIPYPWGDYAKGRFLCSVLTGFIITLPLIPLFTTNATNDALQWGLSQPLAFSQVLAFMLTSFSLFIVTFAATILVRTRLSQVGFLWIFVPLVAVFFGVLYLSSGVSSNWHFWLAYIKLPISLAILVLALGLTALFYWWTAKSLSRWEIPKKVPVRKKILRTAAVLVVLALVAGLVWKSNRYVSPVDESLSPEEQYQVAVQCQEEGDIYGAAVSFYACGDHADARERCWEMWGKIAPRSTVAVTSYQVAALTEDGTVLITDSSDPDSAITPEDIPNPHRLISIHGGENFMVGLYADGTVGLFGQMRGNQGLEIAEWRDIVGLFVSMDYVAGIRADGTPVIYGGIPEETEAALLRQKNLVAIGTGSMHLLGLHPDGSVTPDTRYSDGRTSFRLYRDIVAVDGGNFHSAVLHADGTVTASGFNSSTQCNTQEWSDVVAIDAGWYSTVGLRADGTVVATGYMGDEEYLQDMSDISTWTDIVAITASQTMLVALRSDGTLVTTSSVERIQDSISSWENICLPS